MIATTDALHTLDRVLAEVTRQFSHEEEGECAGMEQLQCTLYYEPTSELRTLVCNLWSDDCTSLADFFARLEGTAVRGAAAEIDQHDG